MNIVSYDSLYPTGEYLNDEIKQRYSAIKEHWDNWEYVDLKGDTSYLSLYIAFLYDKIVHHGLGFIDEVIKKILWLKTFYSVAEPDFALSDTWIGDLYFLKGDFANSLTYYQLNPGSSSIYLANHVMNIKYHIKMDVDSVELLCTNKKLTTFGYANIDEIVKYCNIILKKEKEVLSGDYLQYIGAKYCSERKYRIASVLALETGSNLDSLFYNQPYSFKTYCFYAIDELNRFCEKISREAENSLREDIHLPRVGEGWVSETNLYYQIKSYVKDFEVLNHHSPSWLGRQHLDIFIPSLNIAFEYQGVQHFEPVDFFGGEKGLSALQERDNIKRKKCTDHRVKLYYVKEGYTFEEIKVIIDSHLHQPPYSDKTSG